MANLEKKIMGLLEGGPKSKAQLLGDLGITEVEPGSDKGGQLGRATRNYLEFEKVMENLRGYSNTAPGSKRVVIASDPSGERAYMTVEMARLWAATGKIQEQTGDLLDSGYSEGRITHQTFLDQILFRRGGKKRRGKG